MNMQKIARAQRAQASQTAWRALTIDQQLEELRARPGECKKQIARLLKVKDMIAKGVSPNSARFKAGIPVVEIQPPVEKKAPAKTDIKAIKALKKKNAEAQKEQA